MIITRRYADNISQVDRRQSRTPYSERFTPGNHSSPRGETVLPAVRYSGAVATNQAATVHCVGKQVSKRNTHPNYFLAVAYCHRFRHLAVVFIFSPFKPSRGRQTSGRNHPIEHCVGCSGWARCLRRSVGLSQDGEDRSQQAKTITPKAHWRNATATLLSTNALGADNTHCPGHYHNHGNKQVRWIDGNRDLAFASGFDTSSPCMI